MTQYGLLPQGFFPKNMGVCFEEWQSGIRSIDGFSEATFDSDEPWGQFVGVAAEREASLWSLAHAIYLSLSRDMATGQSLEDKGGAWVGEAKLQAARSTVGIVMINRTQNSPALVPALYQARQSATGVGWQLRTATQIPAYDASLIELAVDRIEWVSGNLIRAYFAGTPDLSSVSANWEIQITEANEPINNGRYFATGLDAGAYWVEYQHPTRTDDTDDEGPGSGAKINLYPGVLGQFESLSLGAFEASIGGIDTIVTAFAGWDDLYNPSIALVGRDDESDTDYRIRLAEEYINSLAGTLEAVREALLNLPGVTYVFAEENKLNVAAGGLKANSMRFVIAGGVHQQIIDTIGEICGAGIDTNGANSGTFNNASGQPITIYYDDIAETNPYIIANLVVDPAVWATVDEQNQYITDTKTALAAVQFQNGGTVFNHKLVAAISNNVPGIEEIEVLVGLVDPPTTADNLPIPSNEVANITIDRIGVNFTI